MAQVFRLHKGDDNIIDWQTSNPIAQNAISQITDPNGGSVKHEITSIPSPFARIDLVKQAFSEVVNNEDYDLDVNVRDFNTPTIYHKMVSDSLDIGQIFFNLAKLKDKVQVLIWDRAAQIKELKSSSDPAHQTVGTTLEMFLEQDAQAYNFNQMQQIYLLNYIGPNRPGVMNIIGATSPATMFFSTANNWDAISKHLSLDGDHLPFGNTPMPLYKREPDYITYLWAFRKNFHDFPVVFPEVNAYLDKTYRMLSEDLKQALDAVDSNTINSYEPLFIDTANQVNVLGMSLHHKPKLGIKSDFEIQSSIFNADKKALVLPIDAGNTYANMRYTTALWGKANKCPYYENAPMERRTLPFTGDLHPYLTISDFLEDTMIQMPYQLNESAFFNGNQATPKDGKIVSYLLPIKDLFFDYFSVKDLMGEISNGKKMLEMKEDAGGRVVVTLRIPVKGKASQKFIEYERKYCKNEDPDIEKNQGELIEKRFGLGVFPCIDMGVLAVQYRIALFDKVGNTTLECYQGNMKVEKKDQIVRRPKEDICSVESYILESGFDRIKICFSKNSGIVVPKMKQASGSAQYTFSVDFGTTNTHIEYSKDGEPSLALDFSLQEIQMQILHTDYRQDKDVQFSFVDNFTPAQIGAGSDYAFPIRTAFAEWVDVNYRKPCYTLATGNIPFRYEKISTPPHNKVLTELKWKSGSEDRSRVEHYIENLFWLMRNKVLLNNGDLCKTKVVWFYPASMSKAQYDGFEAIWRKLYERYFGSNISNLLAMSESVAPYEHYKSTRGAWDNAVSIDIGGGTTDVYIIENGKPKVLSSFRFASNAIFGDAYRYDACSNGFVTAFISEIREVLRDNQLQELMTVCNEIEKKKISSDIIAFFFSLSSNKFVKGKGIESLDFLKMLSGDQRLKYVFIFFYTAVLYHVAHLMKAAGIAKPATLAFSGNGSRTLSVLFSTPESISDFAELIFEKIYKEKYDSQTPLQIIADYKEPKVATCKGGVIAKNPQGFSAIKEIKKSLLGIDKVTFVNDQPIDQIGDHEMTKLKEEVMQFVNFIFELGGGKKFFNDSFGADLRYFDQAKSICQRNITEYIKQGLEKRRQELEDWGSQAVVEETLFFLPLVGILNSLAREIVKP